MSSSSRPQIDHADKAGIAIAGAGLALAAVIGGGGMFLGGFIPGKAEAAPEPVTEEKVTVQVSSSAPAALTVPQQLLETPGTGIEPDGSVMGSATTPWPMACATESSPKPLASLSRGMTTDAGRLQVTVQSFAPGAGAKAFADQSAAAPSCNGGAGFSRLGNAGAEQAIWNGSRSGARVNGTSFRSGDVIVHVSGAGPQTAATTLSESLETLLAKVCVNPDSAAADYARNPLSPEPGPWMVTATAEIDHPGKPEIPTGADYKATPIPATGLVSVQDVTPKDTPSWPVWPLMPEAPERPSAPEAPEAEPVLTQSIQVQKKDEQGPGCGWAWTGQSPAAYDSMGTYLANLETTLKAMHVLDTDAKGWQGTISTYWQAVADYSAMVVPWNDYVAEVREVNAAWEVIEAAWNRYYYELGLWEENERQIEQFNTARTEAQELWQSNLRQCRIDNGQRVGDDPQDVAAEAASVTRQALTIVPAARITPTPTPSTTPTPSSPAPSPSPSQTSPAPSTPAVPDTTPELPAQPEVTPEPVDCAVKYPRPDILDMEGPSSYAKPSEPADPRPANWEKIVAGEAEEDESGEAPEPSAPATDQP